MYRMHVDVIIKAPKHMGRARRNLIKQQGEGLACYRHSLRALSDLAPKRGLPVVARSRCIGRVSEQAGFASSNPVLSHAAQMPSHLSAFTVRF
jgi:hypothetical protein